MSDNENLLVGGTDLSSIFETVMTEFACIKPDDDFKKAYTGYVFMEMAVRLRLARWKCSVVTVAKERSSRSIGDVYRGDKAKEILEAMTAILQRKEEQAGSDEEQPSTNDVEDTPIEHFEILQKVEQIVERRMEQDTSSSLFYWTPTDARRYKLFIDKLNFCVKQLEDLFPVYGFPLVLDEQQRLADEEVEEVLRRFDVVRFEPEEKDVVVIRVLLKAARATEDMVLTECLRAVAKDMKDDHSSDDGSA